jgi:hypothetical protein
VRPCGRARGVAGVGVVYHAIFALLAGIELSVEMTGICSRSLATGVIIFGPFGDLGDNPRGHTHRVRHWIFGVVLCIAGEHNYKIRFENDTENVSFSTSLRVESHDLGVPFQ